MSRNLRQGGNGPPLPMKPPRERQMVTHTHRRLTPSRSDSDYYYLKTLGRDIGEILGRPGTMEARPFVLDLGCGEVRYLPLFKALGASYSAADLRGNPAAELTIGSDGRVPCPDESFDLVLSIQVLEHVENVESYLREAHRVLKPDGKLILSTNLWWTYHPYPVDLCRWTRAGLHRTLECYGFEPVETRWILGLFGYSFQLRVQCWKGLLDNKGPVARVIFRGISFVYQNLMALADKITPDEIGRDNAAVFVVLAAKRSAGLPDSSTR